MHPDAYLDALPSNVIDPIYRLGVVALVTALVVASSILLTREKRAVASLDWVLALSAGVLLRTIGVATPSLWLDELGTWWVASATTVAGVFERAYDSVPGTATYSLTMHEVIGLCGSSEGCLRAPSIVAGMAALLLMYAFVLHGIGASRRAATLAMLLLGVTFFHNVHSSDARPYAIAYLLALASLFAWFRFLRGYTLLSAAMFAFASAASIYLHWLSVTLVAAQVAVGAYMIRRDGGPRTAYLRLGLGTGLIALLIAPAVPKILVFSQRAHELDWVRSLGLTSHLSLVVEALLDPVPILAVAIGLLLPLLLRRKPQALATPLPEEHRAERALLLLALLPALVLAVGWALTGTCLLVPRYLFYSSAILVPLGAMLLCRLQSRLGQRAVIALTILPALFGLQLSSFIVRGTFKDYAADHRWREGVAALDQARSSGKLLLYRSGFIEDNLDSAQRPLAFEFVRAPINGIYSRRIEMPVLGLPKTWDPVSRERLDRVVATSVEVLSRGDDVLVFGMDQRTPTGWYFDDLIERMRTAPKALAVIEDQRWGRIRLIRLRGADAGQ